MLSSIHYCLFLESPIQLGMIFLVVLILFGPGKLPEVFRSLGEGVRKFKDASNGTAIEASAAPTALPRTENAE